MKLNLSEQMLQAMTRREFFRRTGTGIGSVALATMLRSESAGAAATGAPSAGGAAGALGAPSRQALAVLGHVQKHYAVKAKSVIYMHMAGSPSQIDLFDPKPKLQQLNGQQIPKELIKNERFAFIKGAPKILGSPYRFARHGKCGMEISELLPNLGNIADDIALVRSMHTDQFNHAPAQILMNTGSAQIGRPSMGSWLSYGLGTENRDLPGFIVLLSGQNQPDGGMACWSCGFLPTLHQGVQFRSDGDPVLAVSNPAGIDAATRRQSIDAIRDLNQMRMEKVGDPQIAARIDAFELAFRMQSSVPELMDIASETQETRDLYGAKPGRSSFANNCLLSRRLVERGVRFVQLYHWGWDTHGTNPGDDLITALPQRCKECDQGAAALVMDLKRRGMLDETLVIWGGEFGRTPMNEERNGSKFLGRDHHPHCFSLWLAGGGVRGGQVVGATDELGYTITDNPVHIHDLQATILRLMGINHEKLTFKFQGRDFRLTDVEGKVVEQLV